MSPCQVITGRRQLRSVEELEAHVERTAEVSPSRARRLGCLPPTPCLSELENTASQALLAKDVPMARTKLPVVPVSRLW